MARSEGPTREGGVPGEAEPSTGDAADSTERLRESEERFRALASVGVEGVAIHDRGEILEVNEAFRRLFGVDRDQAIGRSVLEFAAPEFRDLIRRNIASGREEPYEAEGIRQDGSRFRATLSSKEVRYHGRRARVTAVLDLTALIEAEQALRDSEAFGSSLLESSPNAIVVIDADTSVRYANRAFRDLTGFTEEEIVGRRAPYPWWTPETLEKTGRDLAEAMRSGARNLEEVFQRKSGERFWVEVFSAPVEGREGDRYYVANWVDITERKEAERERRRLEERMQTAQKLESLGVLAGGIAHDFNNLLMGITGNASLLLRDLPEGSRLRESADRIEQAARAATDLTSQMLAYSGKGKLVFAPVDVSELVERMATLLRIPMRNEIDLRLDLDRDLPPIEADASQINQVIMNLIINASESSGEGPGVVWVRTFALDVDRSFLSESCTGGGDLPEGAYTCLEVSDTGCGMDEETRRRIFDPFFTTKPTGRGLGLAAVLGIVRGHEGAIRIQSEPGRGTRVQVAFPRSDPG